MRLQAINQTNYIKSIDTDTTIRLNVYNNEGKLADLSDYESADVVIGNKTGRLRSFSAGFSTDSSELSFQFDSDDLLPAGYYLLEVHLNKSNGDVRVAPSENHFKLNITKSIDQVGQTINTIVFDEFEQIANYAQEQGDYAKTEADRLSGMDVSQLDQELTTHKADDALNDVHGLSDKVIVEQGQNTNGRYVRFGDGTQICIIRKGAHDFNVEQIDYAFPADFTNEVSLSLGFLWTSSASKVDVFNNTVAMVSTDLTSFRIFHMIAGDFEEYLYVTAIGGW